MAKYQQFLSRIGSNRDRAALRGIFSQFLTDGDPPALKDLVLASIVLSGAETTQITISGACTTAIAISSVCTTGISIASGAVTAISFGASAGKIVDAAASVSLYGGGTTGDALVLQGSSADAGQKITITGATGTTILGNLILGASGSETVVFTAKLASQLYHNLSDTAYTVLKIHNHDTTAEIGGAEYKGEMINTTGTVEGVVSTWSYEPTGLTGTPTGVTAGTNVLALAPSHIITTGNFYALTGEAQIHGTLNGGAVNVAGVIGVISGAGATTLCLHMAGVQSAVTVTNPTTGTLSHFLANTVGTGVIDNLICMQDSEYITNFASFNQEATDKCVEASVAIPGSNTTHVIRVLIGGAEGYIPVYAAKTC